MMNPMANRGAALVQCWDLGGQDEYYMAHSLFIPFTSIIVLVTNLEQVMQVDTREAEIKELCRWMQLAYALCSDPGNMKVIVVGTRRAKCRDMDEVWRTIIDGLSKYLGGIVYDKWVRLDNTGKSVIEFVGIENSTANEDSKGSGLIELETVVKQMANDISLSREEIPVR